MDLEIRLHGRGGQGGVTCAKILAAMYADLDYSVQSFGDYAGERSGAPVRAYARVSDRPITNRNKAYHPDHLIVLDPTLLGADVVAGLRPGGLLLVNTSDPIESFHDRFPGFRLAVVDATEIARRHGIGTRSVVIVNTTIAGAFARMKDLSLKVLEEAYGQLGLRSNIEAAREAYDAVVTRDPEADALAQAEQDEAAPSVVARAPVEPLQEHRESLATGLKTGSWRTQRPAYREELAPCNAFCPAGNDVVGFIQALAKGDEREAALVLRRTQPLAAVCGRVCPAPCMEGCNRSEFDGTLNIRGLERWIGDHVEPVPFTVERAPEPRRIAIVGGGPAGLAAAHTIALAGHEATIFERERRLGGVLFTGIPAYRLPPAVVEREVEAILDLGVIACPSERLDRARVQRLVDEFDAVVIATGLQRLRELDAAGELAGVEQGIEFLHRVNGGGQPRLHGHVVVLGGGNTAIDCARSALRLGADRVTLAYRRTRTEMPAIGDEVTEALAEGVALQILRQPVRFVGDGTVHAIELAEVRLGEPDESGRRRPIVSDVRHELRCDLVIVALGQSADRSLLPAGAEIVDGRVIVDGVPTRMFAAGDVATGHGTVTHAIGDGRRAAGLALAALGEAITPFERPDKMTAVPVSDIRLDHFERRSPAPDHIEYAGAPATGFGEVNHGLTDPYEAHRCFSCGHCTRCDTCLVYCPEGIIRRRELDYEVDYSYCKGCGICVTECPRRAMEMVPECRTN